MKTKSLLRPRSLANVTAASLGLVAAALFVAAPAQALTFNFTTISGDTLTPDQAAAFQTAANAWSAVLTDPVTVNVSIGFASDLPNNVLGDSSQALYAARSYATYTAALASDQKTSLDSLALASLPGAAAINNVNIRFTDAQAKALGIQTYQTLGDGNIEFNSAFSFATSRDANGNVPANQYDLIGVAEHEIGHVLGFLSGVNSFPGARSGLDLFRYGSPGALSFGYGAAAYFSLDKGVTQIASFSDGVQYTADHWANMQLYDGQQALMAPATPPGVAVNITPLDVAALDVIGWDATPASEAGFYVVPEPSTWALLAVGTGALGLALRRRAAARA